MPSEDIGTVVTVDGRIDPDEVGVTTTHEHLFLDAAEAWFELPDEAQAREVATDPISLDNLWYVRRNPQQHRDNLQLTSMEEAITEVNYFQRAGGDTVVDVTPKAVGCDPKRVRGIARQTGLNIVHGTAYYTKASHPDRFESQSQDELGDTLEDEFVSDVVDGIDDTDVRAGIVGEIGLSDTIYPDEEAALRAGARAARRTGASLTIHPPGRTPESQRNRTYPTSRWALEVLDIVEEEGLPPGRVIMDHMDRTIYEDLEYQYDLAERGAYLEYDVWGLEVYLENYNDSYPSDTWRAEAVCDLIDRGYASQLVFGQDVYTKTQRRKYGGYGYGHLLENIVPMLKERGVDQDVLDRIFVDNPRDVLTFVDPEP
jgi:phosphotriesterase-related protein